VPDAVSAASDVRLTAALTVDLRITDRNALAGIAGVALGANLNDSVYPVPGVHKALGGIAIALVSVQMASFIFRPSAVRLASSDVLAHDILSKLQFLCCSCRFEWSVYSVSSIRRA